MICWAICRSISWHAAWLNLQFGCADLASTPGVGGVLGGCKFLSQPEPLVKHRVQ
jgi:hypothetical protein